MKTLLLSEVPFISRMEMVRVDELMITKYSISLLQMMENAGRNLADFCQSFLNGNLQGKQIAVLCGSGNNGGGGLAAARHLFNRGANIKIAITGEAHELKEIPAQQLRAVRQMQIEILQAFPRGTFDLYIDALIGYGLIGATRGKTSPWIDSLNRSEAPVISLDIPSGMDADSGEPLGHCVRANATLTPALPKLGMQRREAVKYFGEIYIADIGVPAILFTEIGKDIRNLFHDQSIIKLKY